MYRDESTGLSSHSLLAVSSIIGFCDLQGISTRVTQHGPPKSPGAGIGWPYRPHSSPYAGPLSLREVKWLNKFTVLVGACLWAQEPDSLSQPEPGAPEGR